MERERKLREREKGREEARDRNVRERKCNLESFH